MDKNLKLGVALSITSFIISLVAIPFTQKGLAAELEKGTK